MANRIPKEVKKEQIDAWIVEGMKVALFKSTSNCNTDGTILYSGCTNEVAVSGTYVAGGATLTKSAWGAGSDYVDTVNAKMDATDSQWTTVTWGAGSAPFYAVVYNTTTSKIRFVYDFAAEKTVSGGTFTIQWSNNGLVKIA
jgi:hypothetical protein